MTTTVTSRIAAIALTLFASATLLIGTVGPATSLGTADTAVHAPLTGAA